MEGMKIFKQIMIAVLLLLFIILGLVSIIQDNGRFALASGFSFVVMLALYMESHG